MAKTTAKPAPEKAKPKKAAAKSKSASVNIEKASEEALAKLKALAIEPQLQADIEWCIGSYRADKNPIGLFDVVGHALTIFKGELKKKTKGITPKLIADLEKALLAK